MADRVAVTIQSEPFDSEAETGALRALSDDIGAIVAFTGLCRSEANALHALELEHYPGMAERQITGFAQEAMARFDLQGLRVVHRHGRILPGEPIVLVLAASRHRQAAFDGANFLMDYLKTDAPFWKKEHRHDGSSQWVSARDADDAAKDKWVRPKADSTDG